MQLNAIRRRALKYLLGPPPMALQRVRERSIAFSDKIRQLTPSVGEDLVNVIRHNLYCMNKNAELLRQDRSRVPIDILTSPVGIWP